MKAIANFVWVDPDVVESKTVSGIITSTTAEAPNTGIVVAIGKACDRDIIGELKEGDRVMFDRNHIRRIPHPDTNKEVFIFHDRNIWAILP